ncbi:MAG: 16S rRNA (cytosine(1402)-N(4))-methyltransferase RsmH [Pseudohongiellaceae bacterium]
MAASSRHETVLLTEAVDALIGDVDGVYIDGTFGRGGHSQLILARLGQAGSLLAFDKDPEAIVCARELEAKDARFTAVHASFNSMETVLDEKGLTGKVSGVLLDLGVSSPQLDQPERGFSFMQDGPLDMRMNPGEGESASDWVNRAGEKEIADVLYTFGEEKFSRRMARAIVEARREEPITTTGRLAQIVKQANPAWERDRHPATRAFQAIRIFINRELLELTAALDQILQVLQVGGRLVVISFHSLEDRIVKKFIAVQTKGDSFPRHLPVRQAQLNPRLRRIGKAIRAGAEEITANPRARSAMMRVAEKVA